MKMTLQVENVAQAEPSLPLTCTFSQRGGLIGSGSEATWQVQDLSRAIPEVAARIVVVEGHFTIEALGGAQIYANGSKSALAQGRTVMLSDRDRITLGELSCVVRVGEERGVEMERGTISTMVGAAQGHDDSLVIDGELVVAPEFEKSEAGRADPLEAMDGTRARSRSSDPLEAFGEHDRQSLDDGRNALVDTVQRMGEGAAQATAHDLSGSISASFAAPRVQRDQYGFEEATSGFSYDAVDQVEINMQDPVDHIALRPLSRALGLPFGPIPQGESDQLLAEIGASLRSAVEGLNRLYARRGGKAGNFPLASMHLHAIEDNPLRFSEGTDEALHALFAKRGAVYLSPAAAMEESLTHLDHHQSATEEAVNKALDAVMAALKPAALERRFASYARDAGPASGQARDAWCWQMYKAYFSELASPRQRGLQMLFWEVFGYEYQALMRAFEMSRDLVAQGDEA